MTSTNVRAWTCIDEPVKHGAFPQSGLEEIAAKYGLGEASVALTITGLQGSRARQQLEDRAARGEKAMRRFACPICQKNGATGFVRPATQDEIARMVERAKQGKAA